MLLPFIKDEKLFEATKTVIDNITTARNRPDSQIYKNAIDPFSALFDATVQGIDLKEWLEQEKSRQIQKTFQNAIGEFHQTILGSIDGWENLGSGNILDIKNDNKKIVAEIKNKFNTTKGDHKVRIYDNLKTVLKKEEYKDFTGYLVEIIPYNKKAYDKPFIPPDNTTHKQRSKNKNIRIISGQLFYDLASGHKNALKALYMKLPLVIAQIRNVSPTELKGNTSFEILFDKTY